MRAKIYLHPKAQTPAAIRRIEQRHGLTAVTHGAKKPVTLIKSVFRQWSGAPEDTTPTPPAAA